MALYKSLSVDLEKINAKSTKKRKLLPSLVKKRFNFVIFFGLFQGLVVVP